MRPINFIRPDSIGRATFLGFLALGAVLGCGAAAFTAWAPPTRGIYLDFALALVAMIAALFVSWLLRLWLVGRVEANIEGRLSEKAERLGAALILLMLGALMAVFACLVFLGLGLLFDWNLTRWGAALIAAISVQLAFRAAVGVTVNVGLIAHSRQHRRETGRNNI